MDREDKKAYSLLVSATLILLGFGMVFYHFVEKFSWVDAYYFCVVTLTTVGYGDFVPKTTIGKIFTTFYLMVGIGIITTFITTTVKRRAKKIEKRRAARHNSKVSE